MNRREHLDAAARFGLEARTFAVEGEAGLARACAAIAVAHDALADLFVPQLLVYGLPAEPKAARS